jgi:hypothetical protein
MMGGKYYIHMQMYVFMKLISIHLSVNEIARENSTRML